MITRQYNYGQQVLTLVLLTASIRDAFSTKSWYILGQRFTQNVDPQMLDAHYLSR